MFAHGRDSWYVEITHSTSHEICRDWIGLHLFNDDTRPSGHISRPGICREFCFASLCYGDAFGYNLIHGIRLPIFFMVTLLARINDPGAVKMTYTGIILCMRPANGRRRYNVTSSLIGWAHTQKDPCVNGQNRSILYHSNTQHFRANEKC